ncbi:hypothetical protein [uncultured Desulfobacter sp.]|uniref:hypothetical protein n=1 Tax=uncultured Desulfobacter sp. TaxID=240139 RepID=UPI002AAB5999|nr:hypothetical protein [uncultured Desulfobacter sp.]
MICSLSNLKDQDVAQIKDLEKELGVTMLAFSCHDTKPTTLENATLEKIQALEKNLGVALVAVQA